MALNRAMTLAGLTTTRCTGESHLIDLVMGTLKPHVRRMHSSRLRLPKKNSTLREASTKVEHLQEILLILTLYIYIYTTYVHTCVYVRVCRCYPNNAASNAT